MSSAEPVSGPDVAPAAGSQRRVLLGYAAAYAGSAAVQKGLGFALFMWLAHALSVKDYARFGLLYALQTGIAGFAVAGITESVVGMLKDHRQADARRALFAHANTVFLMLALCSGAIGVLVYLVWAGAIGASGADLVWVSIAGIGTAFFTLQSQLTRLNEQHRISLLLNVVPPLVGLLAGFMGFLLVPTVSSYYAGMVGGILLCLLVYRVSAAPFDGLGRARAQLLAIVPLLGPFILIVALGWLSGYGNTYLVQSFFDAADVARFTFAYTLSSIMQLLATSLNQVWSPKFFRVIHELPVAEVERSNRKFYALQGALLGAIGAVVLVLAPIAIRFAGPSLAAYRHLELEMFFLFAAYAVSVPWWHMQNYYLAHGRGPDMMYLIIASSVLGMLAWLAASYLLGSPGVYVGVALMSLVRTMAAYVCARRMWPLRLMWEGSLLALLLLAAGTMVALQLR